MVHNYKKVIEENTKLTRLHSSASYMHTYYVMQIRYGVVKLWLPFQIWPILTRSHQMFFLYLDVMYHNLYTVTYISYKLAQTPQTCQSSLSLAYDMHTYHVMQIKNKGLNTTLQIKTYNQIITWFIFMLHLMAYYYFLLLSQ